MLDKKFLLNYRDLYEENMKKRCLKPDYETFESLNSQHKKITTQIQSLRASQNKNTKFSEEAKKNKEELIRLTNSEKKLNLAITKWLYEQPNILLNEVPFGKDETENKVVFSTEIPQKKSIPHYDLIDNLILKEESANLSGSRFLILKKDLSNLKRALVSFLLDHNQENGYDPYDLPYIVNSEILYSTGQLPKFAEDAFQLTNEQWLISTGEIPLVNLFYNKILSEDELPKLCTTFSPCFRSEAGSASRDTKGLIRLHQFHKVELVSICKPEDAEYYHQKQLETAKSALNKLGLPYQIVIICSGDTGFTAAKQYDIEVWLPGSNRFLEIASCSQCGSFQAIRGNIKYKDKNGKNTHVHTLNGSCLPLERLLAAIIENFYDEKNNSIVVPDVLNKYFNKNIILL
ncbi:serine--tRNA ligase [Alphaproteobacteria bacterium endosymbiont of Tiliacea citrago]|uniref:serine--tRNA ligase n=1 Tax=Alphaproteobacteria bacterium endosymbiont of Tiliacea citrago TaxID=3077944 RepID=UPI00313F175E